MYTLYSTREWKIERENKTRYSSISTNIYVRSNERMNEFFFFFDNSFGGYDEDRWSKRKKGGKEGDYAKDPLEYIYILFPSRPLPSSSKHVCAGWDRSKRNCSIPFDNSSLLNSSYSLVRLVPVERQSSCEAVRDR